MPFQRLCAALGLHILPIRVDIWAGSHILHACQGASKLSRILNCPVSFDFNNEEITIKPEDDPERIAGRFTKRRIRRDR